jgi:hypothetical protein
MPVLQLIHNNCSVGNVQRDLVPDHLVSKMISPITNREIPILEVPEWHKDFILSHEEYEEIHGQEPLPFHYKGHKEKELIHALLECDYYS